MNLWQKWKLWRAWKKCEGQIKEAVKMSDKRMVDSRMAWGGVCGSVAIFAGKLLPMMGLAEWTETVQTFLAALGLLLGVIGARGVLGDIKEKLGD